MYKVATIGALALVLFVGLQLNTVVGQGGLAATITANNNQKKEVTASCLYVRIKNGVRYPLRVPAEALHYNVWGVKKGRGNVQCTSRLRGHGRYSCWTDPVSAMESWMNMVRTSKYYFAGGRNTIGKIAQTYVGSGYDPIMNQNGRPNIWANNISKTMGIGPNTPLDPNNPALVIKLMQAVARQEGHCNVFPYNKTEIVKAAEKVFGVLDKAKLESQISQKEVSQNNQWYQKFKSNNQNINQPSQQPRASQSSQAAPAPKAPQSGEESKLGQDRSSWVSRFLGGGRATTTKKASLSCATIDSVTRLRWSCPNGTTVSRGYSDGKWQFNTHGAGAGAVSVSLELGTKYTVQCLGGHSILAEESCKIQDKPSKEAASYKFVLGDKVDSVPSGVIMHIEYDNNTVTWATLGARECLMSVAGRKRIAKNGSLDIGEQSLDIYAELKCNTVHGKAIKYKKIVVE